MLRSLVVAAPLALLLACPAETPPSPVTPEAPARPEAPPATATPEPSPVPGDRVSSTGWVVYARLDLEVRDWRFALLEKKSPPHSPPEIEAGMSLVGVSPLVTQLGSLKSGEVLEVIVLSSPVWDHPGLLTDVHTVIVDTAEARGLKLTIPEAVIPVHGVDSIRGDFEVICMEAKNAKSGEEAFLEATRKGIVNVRVTKAFREASEMPVGDRVAHLYAVAKDEAQRRWRCAELEAMWPPSAAAKQKIADLDKAAPASAPAHPKMPARMPVETAPGPGPASAPAP